MDKNPLLRHLMKVKTEDVAHTSAYASSQNKGFGASSTESFAARKAINNNRTTIKSYNNSKIIFDAYGNKPHPAAYDPSKDSKIQNNTTKDTDSKTSIRPGLTRTPTVNSPTQSTQPRSFTPRIKPNIKPKF